MKKLWKWIVGLFTFIVGILVLSGKKNKRVKEIKKDIKSNKKKTKAVDKNIDAAKETDIYLRKALENKKKALDEIEKQKKSKPKKKTAKKASSRLKNIGKGKK